MAQITNSASGYQDNIYAGVFYQKKKDFKTNIISKKNVHHVRTLELILLQTLGRQQ